MSDKYFFDIPVYRIREEEYYEQRETYISEKLLEGPLTKKEYEKFYSDNPGLKRKAEDHLIKVFGGPWTFNEIIGYIRLYFTGSQLRGEYWKVDAKRIVKTRKKCLLLIPTNFLPK